MRQFPFICFQKQIFFRHFYFIFLRKRTNNLTKFFLIGRAKVNRHAKPCDKR